MKVEFKNNTLFVNTGVPYSVYEKGLSDLAVTDEKGTEELFRLIVGENPSIASFGITCNTKVGEYLGVTIVMPIETTIDEVYKKYGKALVTAKKYLPMIAKKAKQDEEDIKELFN